MPLKLMYITNRTDVAEIADDTGVDRIFIDLEYIGKEDRCFRSISWYLLLNNHSCSGGWV